MKLVTPILVIVLLCTYSSFSQSKKTCNTPKEEIVEDLNSITKCAFEKSSSKKDKKELKISYRKVRKRGASATTIVQKETKKGEIKKVICPLDKSGVDNSFSSSNIQGQKLKNLSIQKVLFSVADRIPLFSKCTSNKVNDKRSCFNTEMSKHFAKNFYPERAADDAISGRVFVQFTIDFEGNIDDLIIKSQKKSKLLEKEIQRVISKLPKFTPGSHKNMPVNVTYSLPINLNLE